MQIDSFPQDLMQLDPFSELMKRAHQADELFRKGELSQAHAMYMELVEWRAQALVHDSPWLEQITSADINVIRKLAHLTVLIGNHSAADDLIHALQILYQKNNLSTEADKLILARAYLAIELGALRKADKLLQEVTPRVEFDKVHSFSSEDLSLWEQRHCWRGVTASVRRDLFATLYLVKGRIFASNGAYQNAIAFYDQAQKHIETETPSSFSRTWFALNIARAEACLESGELDSAQQRLDILDKHIDMYKEPGFYIRKVEIEGKRSLLQGDLGKARAKYREVFDFAKKHKLNRATLEAALNYCHVLIFLNQTRNAKEILGAIETYAIKTDQNTYAFRAQYMLALAEARIRSLSKYHDVSHDEALIHDEHSASPSIANKEIHVLESRPPANYLAFFEERALDYHWLLGLSDLGKAKQCLNTLIKTFNSTDSQLIRQRLDGFCAMFLYYTGNWEKAMPIFRDVSEWLLSKGMQPELWQAQRFLASCTTLAGTPDEDVFEENASRLETLANTLPGEERAIYLLNKWTADEELLKLHVDQLHALENKSKHLPWYKRFRSKISILKQLSLILKSVDNRKIALASRKDDAKAAPIEEVPSSWWRLLLWHPFRRATLSFLVLPNSTIIIARRWVWIDYVISSTTRLDLRNQVRKLHESINRNSFINRDWLSRDLIPLDVPPSSEESPSKKRARILSEIADALKLPELFGKFPSYVRKLTLIPDDVLHGVPFSAVKLDNEYLIQRYALSTTYSSEAPQNPKTRSVQKDLGALVVGVSQKIDGHNGLPGVFSELNVVENRLRQRKQAYERLDDLSNTWVPKSAVIEKLQTTEFAHIACHGIFEVDAPSNSGLVFSSQAGKKDTLNLHELDTLNLKGLQLITLSSCWAADNFVLPGRWIISLPETLWRAGAASVFGCLWKVYDTVAAAFMDRFYFYLSQNKSLDQALQCTQIDCLNKDLTGCGSDIDTTDPLIWAGFNLYGAHTRLTL